MPSRCRRGQAARIAQRNGFVVAFEHAEEGGITPERIGEQPAERQQQAEQHPPPHPSLGFEFAELFLGEEGGDRPKEADGDHHTEGVINQPDHFGTILAFPFIESQYGYREILPKF